LDKLLRSAKARAYCSAGSSNKGNPVETEPSPPDPSRNAAAYYAQRDAERRKAEAGQIAGSENS